MNFKRRFWFACILLLYLLSLSIMGCGEQIKEGEIYNKVHEPATQTLMMMPMTITNGKTCTTVITPMWIYDDEDWIIYIKKFNEEKQRYNTRTFYVNEQTFNSVAVGEWFLYDSKICELTDEHVKKRKE